MGTRRSSQTGESADASRARRARSARGRAGAGGRARRAALRSGRATRIGAAVGLLVPGAGPTVTREARARGARCAASSSTACSAGSREGEPLIELGAPGRPGDPRLAAAAGPQRERPRYPIALLGERGLLTSDSTRIDGLVSVTDVATGRLRVVPSDDPVEALETLDERIERNDRWRLPLTIALVVLLVALAFVRPPARAPGSARRRSPRTSGSSRCWRSRPGSPCSCSRSGSRAPRSSRPTSSRWASTPRPSRSRRFGPSQSGRFYGINNLLETMLLAPALLGAALLGRAGIGVAALAFVTDRRQPLRRRRRRARRARRRLSRAAAAASADRRLTLRLAAGVAAGASRSRSPCSGSTRRPAARATSPTRSATARWRWRGDLADRIELSVRRTVASLGAIAVVVGSLARPGRGRARARRDAVLDAFLAGLAVSLVVNDTPGDVLGMGAAIAIALARAPCARARPG